LRVLNYVIEEEEKGCAIWNRII